MTPCCRELFGNSVRHSGSRNPGETVRSWSGPGTGWPGSRSLIAVAREYRNFVRLKVVKRKRPWTWAGGGTGRALRMAAASGTDGDLVRAAAGMPRYGSPGWCVPSVYLPLTWQCPRAICGVVICPPRRRRVPGEAMRRAEPPQAGRGSCRPGGCRRRSGKPPVSAPSTQVLRPQDLRGRCKQKHIGIWVVFEDRHDPYPHIASLTMALQSVYRNTASLSAHTATELRELLIPGGREWWSLGLHFFVCGRGGIA